MVLQEWELPMMEGKEEAMKRNDITTKKLPEMGMDELSCATIQLNLRTREVISVQLDGEETSTPYLKLSEELRGRVAQLCGEHFSNFFF